jgi:hypothetical protein
MSGIATGILLLCGSCYLWGYWSYFNINFLDYISLQDIVGRTLFWVIPIAVLATIPLAWMYLPFLSARIYPLRSLGAVIGFLFVLIFPILMIIAFDILFFGLHDLDAAIIWFCPMLLAGICLYTLKWVRPDKYELQKAAWLTSGLVVGFILFSLFWAGRYTANRCKKDNSAVRRVLVTDCDDDINKRITDPVYVGRLGGFIFVASKTDGKTLAIPESRVRVIDVCRSPQGGQAQGLDFHHLFWYGLGMVTAFLAGFFMRWRWRKRKHGSEDTETMKSSAEPAATLEPSQPPKNE